MLLNNKCDIYCYVDWLALLEHSSDGRSCGKSFVPKMVRQGVVSPATTRRHLAGLGFRVRGFAAYPCHCAAKLTRKKWDHPEKTVTSSMREKMEVIQERVLRWWEPGLH